MRSTLLLILLTLTLLVVADALDRSARHLRSSRNRHGRRHRGKSLRPASSRQSLRPASRQSFRSSDSKPEVAECEARGGGGDLAPEAEHIVTARVEHVGSKTTRLRIRRMLKGPELPTIIFVSACTHACCSSLGRRDTRVFLMGRPEGPEEEEVYPLVSPPLKPTLDNLALVWEAVQQGGTL
ncbi:hypothetical protein Pmani_024956 [Petrolisthes manimaculis]|uniref:Secreted protein n=1 Tax=Petrolisthes manimaculis TaxID=1843537 RepID=A0AAE1P6H5_9EUCA|nr:hypothetical protein Pmani_024956 [Petrolisthes manimaculis]